jgi:Lar family restriction alleviation protein
MASKTELGDDLLPCPFCGSTNVGLHPYDNDTWGKIECKACGSSGTPCSSVDTINAAWNRRVAAAAKDPA